MIRLQKFLSQAGICSRRKGEEYISKGLVTVNGIVITTPGTKIDPQTDNVIIFGNQKVTISEKIIYIALNKPKGYVTSCRHKGEKIVLDLIDLSTRIFPIGRLDKQSKGLLLLTNDGPLHHQLSHPSFEHEKEYIVTTKYPLPDGALHMMRHGIMLDSKQTLPAKVYRLSSNQFRIILKEGRNRQIRRMVQEMNNIVIELERIRIAHIHLKNLPVGKWRFLDSSEYKELIDFCGKDKTYMH